ncbi:hypothetical protein OROMI_014289 [Orobanche minor]
MDFGRKRGRPYASFSRNGGYKKSKEELDSFTSGVGSKSKPCTKFFSTSGCSFGDTCHFMHYFPGYSAHTQLANSGGNVPTSVVRNTAFTDGGPSMTMKTKICNKINTPEGCRYGDKCRFAHSDMELNKLPPPMPHYEDPYIRGPGRGFSQRFEPAPRDLPVANFGVSATAKISVDASFAGAIIGKSGVNSKQICRQTGVKLSIKDHEMDPSKRNIELEGTFDQIKDASSMVRELIMNISAATGRAEQQNMGSFGRGVPPSNYKKKMCDKFSKGLCTFGERCRFAHSANELQNPYA